MSQPNDASARSASHMIRAIHKAAAAWCLPTAVLLGPTRGDVRRPNVIVVITDAQQAEHGAHVEDERQVADLGVEREALLLDRVRHGLLHRAEVMSKPLEAGHHGVGEEAGPVPAQAQYVAVLAVRHLLGRPLDKIPRHGLAEADRDEVLDDERHGRERAQDDDQLDRPAPFDHLP